MDKIKAQIVNNRLDGYSEIKILGDIGSYDGDYLASQIDNLTDRATYDTSTKLRIRINSFGGNVTAAFSIVSAMVRFMAAGGNIETINEGCADSSAGWILACGSRGSRKAMQFASGFLHAPMFEDGRTIEDLPQGSPERKVLEDNFEKLVNIFVSATGKSFSRVKELMDNETELSAVELRDEGFIDEVIEVDNVPKIKNSVSRAQIVNITDNIDYKIKNTLSKGINILNMPKVNELLNLKPEASEGAIQEAVNGIINARKKAESDLAAMTLKYDTVNQELTNVKKEQKDKDEKDIVNYIDKLIELDATKKDQKESLLNMAKADFETFKTIQPLEKKIVNGANIEDGIDAEQTDAQVKEKGIENAKKFFEMSAEKKAELKNSNLSEYGALANDYDKYFSEIK